MKTAMILTAVVAATFLYGTLVGWVVHWCIHQRWSGRLHRAHMRHHLVSYPPGDLESDSYRGTGRDSGLFVFVPAITGAVLILLGAIAAMGAPWWMVAVVAAESAVVGAAHDYVHDAFHIRGHWLQAFGRRWWHARKLHRTHHRNMRRNLGIFWFGWDRVFGTLRDRGD